MFMINRKIAALVVAAASLALAGSVTSPVQAVGADDPVGDVAVEGQMDPQFYEAIDLTSGGFETGSAGVTMWFYTDDYGGPDLGSLTYTATVAVAAKPKKVKGKKVKRKPYKVVVAFDPEEPINPITVSSTVSGSLKSVSCEDASATGRYSQITLLIPRSCFGRYAATGKASLLTSGTDDMYGGFGRDGMSLPRAAI